MALARIALPEAPAVARDYQDWGVGQLMTYLIENAGKDKGNPLVAMPTGTGKSVIPPLHLRRAMETYGDCGRVALMTHVKELVEQNTRAFQRFCPGVDLGVISAGLGLKELGRQVTLAGIASVYKDPACLGPVDLLWIDEAHALNNKDEGMYREVIGYLHTVRPKMRVVGLTATPFRMGAGTLLDGKDALFTDIAVDMTQRDVINWFVAQGYLVPLIEKRTSTRISFDGVKISLGEFDQKQAYEAVTRDGITEAALNESIYYGQTQNRRKWLIFCQNIEHAEQAATYLNLMGIPTACVHSKMKESERDKIIAAYRAGRYRAITNNGVLTTGFDDPDIDMIVVLRGTNSSGLWVQMLGRGTRPIYARGFDLSTQTGRLAAIAASPKFNCLVLDYAGNISRCGPFNDPILPKAKGKGPKGEAPVKLCPQCDTHQHCSVRFCTVCGYGFPENVNITGIASTDAIMAGSEEETKRISTVPVTRIEYKKHHKPGKPPSLEVSYYAGLTRFRDWWCLEHEGWPRQEGRRSWRNASGGSNPPETIDEALERLDELKAAVSLRVWLKPKHSEVMSVSYQRNEEVQHA